MSENENNEMMSLIYPDLEIDNRFILKDEIGKGGFGSIYRAIDKTTN